MTYKTHMVGAAAAALLYATQSGTDLPKSAISAGIAVVSSLLPDIDHKGSKVSRKMKITSAVTRVFTSHRGILHAPLLWVLLGGLISVLPYGNYIAIPFVIGAISHVLLDMLNPMGVPVLWPFVRKKIRIARIPTRSFGETIVCTLLILACVLMLFGLIKSWLPA